MTFKIVSPGVASVPLGALPAVVLDTETTGLDVAGDRVIEIGAVRMKGNPAEAPETFESFVNPGVPVPAAATAIHGIGDGDLASAPAFPEVMAAFVGWAGPSVLIGYSVGFDVGILKNEHQRAGLTWSPPRVLDIRHLAQIIAPNLPEQSLDTTADWLGIRVEGRHRALGDAMAAARIFEALVPRLRDKGIRTLAEAERAIRQRASLTSGEERIGWQQGSEAGGDSDAAVLARIDSFPYRHRVRDLMNAPPLEIGPEASLRDALREMAQRKVSSLFVRPAPGETGHGIITERDVLRVLAVHDHEGLEKPLGIVAHRPLVTIGEDEFVYRAQASMVGRGFRHLGVVDDAGRLVGALSARDLLKQRADDAVQFGSSIEKAQSPVELGQIWLSLPGIAKALVAEGVDARDVASVVSRELRALTHKACMFAEQELVAAGRGPAPQPFAMMVLGSGGRGESLLAMDQDNAMVIAGDAGHGPDAAWYLDFAKRVSDILDAAGVSYCKGGVMASNEAWRKNEAEWRETVGGWITRSRAQDILNCDIFFDARPVFGENYLADSLRRDASAFAKDARVFLSLLALNASNVSAPVGWFGSFKTENGRLDLKRYCIMPIFSAARVAALRHGIEARSTVGRLEAFKRLDLVREAVIDELIESHRVCFNLVLQQQLRDLDRGIKLSNSVAPPELSRHELGEMAWALKRVPAVVDILGTPAGGA